MRATYTSTCHSGTSDLCACGCRGYCSLFPLLLRLKQDLEAKNDTYRLAILDLRADWAAFIEITGFRSWSHGTHPCCLCSVTQDSMYVFDGISLISQPWQNYTKQIYEIDVANSTKALLLELKCMFVFSIFWISSGANRRVSLIIPV